LETQQVYVLLPQDFRGLLIYLARIQIGARLCDLRLYGQICYRLLRAGIRKGKMAISENPVWTDWANLQVNHKVEK